ncbi:MAG: DsbA family protein [Pseudomonadota bacterium]
MTKLAITATALTALTLLPACAQDSSASASTNDMTKAEVEEIVRDYILENPEIVEDALIALQAQRESEAEEAQRSAILANADGLYSFETDYSIGPDNAAVTIVEFFDYRCGFCKRSVDEVAALPVKFDGDVRVVFKELPILSPESRQAALAALAAGKQGKYLDMHVAMMSENSSLSNPEINRIAASIGVDVEQMRNDMQSAEVLQQLADSEALARKLDVSGTPAFFIGEHFINGANLPLLNRLINEELG